jgi:uncharacterized repeat protein (TIGR01451 family)
MKNGKARNLLGLALLGWGVVFLPGATLAFDAAAEFSTISNPNGFWSYGSSYGVGSVFILDSTNTQHYAGLFLSGWLGVLGPTGYPNVLHNGTAGAVTIAVTTTYGPGQLAQSPGPSNEVSVIRWTAPFSGTCTVAATFTCLSSAASPFGGSVDVHILRNGASIFDAGAVNEQSPASFSGSQAVITGDTIDFVVGNGGNGPNDDTTGLTATITPDVVGNTDLGVSAIVAPGSTVTDSNVIYTIVVTNGGPDNAIGVVIANALPPQVSFIACDAGTNGSCGAVGPGRIVGSYPFLAADDTRILIITGQVLCSAVNRAVLTNTATVSAFTDDPSAANNQVSTVVTNSNPLRKPFCSNTLSFTESFRDHVGCSSVGATFCQEFMGDTLTISITIPLTGVDITQFNQDTFFDLTIGDFTFDDNLGDDPHYLPGKTRATFIQREINGDDDRVVGHQTVRLKWTAEQLTAIITLSDLDILDSAVTPVLADRYDGHATGLVTDAVTANVGLGNANASFDVVTINGAVLTGTVIGLDGMSYTVSAVRLKGTGSH